jgi:molybdopterin converting factor small subunit
VPPLSCVLPRGASYNRPMPTVYIPSHMRHCCDGRDRVRVPAGTLRAVLDALDAECPGIKPLLLDDGRVRGDLAIAINTEVTENSLVQPIHEDDEVHLVPSIAGG